MRNQFVSRNPDCRPIGIHMRVEVDQPRCDELAAGIEYSLRPLGRNIRLQRLDDTEANADIALCRAGSGSDRARRRL